MRLLKKPFRVPTLADLRAYVEGRKLGRPGSPNYEPAEVTYTEDDEDLSATRVTLPAELGAFITAFDNLSYEHGMNVGYIPNKDEVLSLFKEGE